MKHPSTFTSRTDIPEIFRKAITERVGTSLHSIRELSREDFVKEQIGWELGNPHWYDIFENWLNKAGLEIVEKK